MQNQHPNIVHAIENGYSFSVSDCLGRAWEYVKRQMGMNLAYTVLYMIISGVANLIPILGSLASLFISAPMALGWGIAKREDDLGNPLALGSFFKGFDKLVPLFVGTLLFVALIIAIIVPIAIVFGAIGFIGSDLTGGSGSVPGVLVVLMLILIPLMIVGFLLFSWTYYIIYFHDYQAVDAMKASYNIVKQNLGSHIKLLLATMGLALLGFMALIVGILVALPVIYVMYYEVYKDITKMDEETERDVLDHFTPMD